jgi:hypothetical protein
MDARAKPINLQTFVAEFARLSWSALLAMRVFRKPLSRRSIRPACTAFYRPVILLSLLACNLSIARGKRQKNQRL